MTSASYDGDGLRASETWTPSGGSASTDNFVWDTTTSTASLIMDSTNAYIYAGAGTPAEQVNLSTGTASYLVADSLGSVRGVVSSSGTLLASTEYDAWGNPETSGGLSGDTPFGFAGAYTDSSGLVYLINRYYDPTTGQFVSVDPEVQETLQAYLYAGDDPVNGTDLNGLDRIAAEGDTCAVHPNRSACRELAGGGTIVMLLFNVVADATSAGVKELSKLYGKAVKDLHGSDYDVVTNSGMADDLLKASRGITGIAIVMTVIGDASQHKSVGYAAGDALGGAFGSGVGALGGALACAAEVDVVGIACAAGGGVAGGLAWSKVGSRLGDLFERFLKRRLSS
jgi:RHS repeat-associated protein